MSKKSRRKGTQNKNTSINIRTKEKKTDTNKRLVLYTVIGLLAVVVLFIALKVVEPNKNIAAESPPPIENQPIAGNPNAGVTIIEFGDFKCPGCKVWNEQVFPRVQKEYLDTGIAKLAYINVLFHGEESERSALAAESVLAQDPDSYWAFHKALFNKQPTDDAEAPWITNELLLDLAKQYAPKVNQDKLAQDIKNKTTKPQLDADTNIVKMYNIHQTPSILINGTVVNNPFDYEEIVSLIEKAKAGRG
ncbi:DsbA family protein [Aneurinibacillus aneurinilyticus]|jgi:protein-disulfide isomerase|uniref:DsbA family protein n=1 Tax=Aneurinibacillus aneurinilyticus TaxID=1391 RepID=A0A848D0R8_ANEAE|nr:DsbA family protein [Aneurinibacillus aneurinilyticus]MCI1696729.1 DsbA family protein [Aneurinibacillus aneurinilyticus]NMF00782.1 DsbA family protein [Aneurinibacillus aneurinilyticus]